MKINFGRSFAIFTMVVAVAALAGAQGPTVAEGPIVAANCNISELSSCVTAFASSNSPEDLIAACCASLIKQQPCFCQFLSNPFSAGIFQSAGLQQAFAACQVTVDQC